MDLLCVLKLLGSSSRLSQLDALAVFTRVCLHVLVDTVYCGKVTQKVLLSADCRFAMSLCKVRVRARNIRRNCVASCFGGDVKYLVLQLLE
jgi:hypothetical protein